MMTLLIHDIAVKMTANKMTVTMIIDLITLGLLCLAIGMWGNRGAVRCCQILNRFSL